MKLDLEGIKKVIPHRDPMLLVTTVEELVPGESIVTTFYVDPAREIFKGHFPEEGKIPLFLGINNVRFLRKILPGDTIEIRARLASERAEKAIATCSAEVYDHGELAVTGDVTLAMR